MKASARSEVGKGQKMRSLLHLTLIFLEFKVSKNQDMGTLLIQIES